MTPERAQWGDGTKHMAKLGFRCTIATLVGIAAATSAGAEEAKPYTVEAGRVDANTFHGYQLFTKFCQRCHGPDGVGLSYPYMPAVIDMLKGMTEQQFKQTVVNGRQCGEPLMMPAFGEEPDVMLRLNDIYAYLRARGDGAIGPGRPKRIGE